jgi:nitroreductase
VTGLDAQVVEGALTDAIRAPSIHNTQPWRFELRDRVLRLYADRSRQLGVADPDGHSLMISCGAVLALTDLALRAAGWSVEVNRSPDGADPDVLAELRGLGRVDPTQLDLDRLAASRRRRSERRPFVGGRPAAEVVDRLREAVASGGVYAHFPSRDDENLGLAVAVGYADRYQRRDADYLAEMATWTQVGADRADGIPTTVIPHVPACEPRHTDIPLRDFEAGVPGAQLIDAGIDEQPLLAVIFTRSDTASARLEAGEAMIRLMIDAELAGLASCPLSQAVDLLAFRVRLKTLMDWTDYPQMILRLGRPPVDPPAPLTRRRAVADILTVD